MFYGVPYGVQGRSTISEDQLGAIRYRSYTTTLGVETFDPQTQIRLFNDTGAATLDGGVYMIGFDGDEEENPKILTCAAVTVDVWTVVSDGIVADQAKGWFTIQGYCNALVDGDATDVTKDDFLKIVAATNADAFIDDTTSRTADSAAIACEDNLSTQALTKVYLFGDRHDID